MEFLFFHFFCQNFFSSFHHFTRQRDLPERLFYSCDYPPYLRAQNGISIEDTAQGGHQGVYRQLKVN